MLENRLRVKALLSHSPAKTRENFYRVRTKAGDKLEHLPPFAIRETVIDSTRGISVSPRKNKLSSGGLFRNAHQIAAADTFLPDKAHRLANTNGSSSPRGSEGQQAHLMRPLNIIRNNRSMSNPGKEGKTIQRTVSIVIGGKSEELRGGRELMDTLSKIILGEPHSDDFFLECLEESSIHGS